MTPRPKLWKVSQPDAEQVSRLQKAFGLSQAIAMVLANRNVPADEVTSFFEPKLRDLSDPLAIPDMRIAVKRIWEAIRNDEKIIIHGDFDTDGITSTALLHWVLRENGARVSSYLPHRIDDGYGLSPESLSKCVDGHTLVITVDCGITSVEGAQAAKERGVDLIITDHHQPGDELPDAYAIVNPKLHPDQEHLHVLAGVGVCFKLCHAMLKYAREEGFGGETPDLKEGLDLVALGTVADIVPLRGENRCLVRHGMKVLGSQRRPGIHALCGTSGVRDRLRTEDIAFRLAPRLNAAGRMGDARDALDLLQADSVVKAHDMAQQLNQHNRLRQEKEEATYQMAMQQIEDGSMLNSNSLVVHGMDWHRGVIGIVASRLAQQFNRPSIVLTLDESGELHGSGRSIPGINLVETLDACKSELGRFGGHPMAVGLALHVDHLQAFSKKFEQAISISSGEEAVAGTLDLEGVITLNDIADSFFSELEMLQPFGHQNSAPVFQFNELTTYRVLNAGVNNSRGTLYDHKGNRINFIFFGRKPKDLPPPPWDVAAIAEMNYYNGVASPQLQILDVRPAEA